KQRKPASLPPVPQLAPRLNLAPLAGSLPYFSPAMNLKIFASLVRRGSEPSIVTPKVGEAPLAAQILIPNAVSRPVRVEPQEFGGAAIRRQAPKFAAARVGYAFAP